MKKLLFSLAAMLLCFLAFSQEAEGTGKYTELQIIPRVDLCPYTSIGSAGDGSSGLSLGSSSIYTLLEGAFSDKISYTVSNHWLSSDPLSLYQATLRSDSGNWLDMCYVDFSLGNFDIVVGKDIMCTGGSEYEEWDVDVDDVLASRFWNEFPAYQWGGKIGYTIGDKTKTTLWLQAVTSPFGERPFLSGRFAYSAQLKGEYGPYSNYWSFSVIESAAGRFAGRLNYVAYIGNMLSFDKWNFTFDWSNCTGFGNYLMVGSSLFRLTAMYAPSEKFDFGFKGNYYISRESGRTVNEFNGGLAFHYFPVESLRVHANVAYDTFAGCLYASVGAKFNLYLLRK